MIRNSHWRSRLQEGSLYGLLFLLPFSKAAVEIAFGLLLLGWVLERWDPGTRFESLWCLPRLRPLAFAAGAYLLVCALSIIGSAHFEQSLRGFVSKWLEYLLLFLIAADLGARPMVVRRSAFVIAWSAGFVLIEAAAQEWFGRGLFRGFPIHGLGTYDRIIGPYENPTDLATYLMVAVLCLLGYAVIHRRLKRWLLWVLLLVLVVCLGRTMALGVWIALGLAAVVVLIMGNRAMRRATIMLMGATVLSAGLLLAWTGYTSKILTLSDRGTADRVVMWQSAINMIKDRPILGHGVNTFMATYLDYWVGGERMPRYAHNCYLQVAAETGLIGLAAFLWLLWRLFSAIRGALRPPLSDEGVLLLGLFAGLLAFAVHAAIDTNFYALRQAALFWVLAGLALGFTEHVGGSPPAP